MAKESVSAWIDDFAPSMGAAIAYYTAFSIAPLLIIVIAIAGFAFGNDAASGYLYGEISGLLGDEGGQAVKGMVNSAGSSDKGTVATVIGIVLVVIGATTVFAELQSALDRIWKSPAAVKAEGLWGLLRSRVLSLGLVVSIGFLLLVSLVLSSGLAALGEWWGGAFESFKWLLQLLNFVVSLIVIAVMFALMYKILPRVQIGWRDVWIGAVVTALLFTLGKFLLGLYLGRAAVASSFGAAGSLALLLVWVYYSAQIFLLGAEFTWVYAHRVGSQRGQDKPAPVMDSGATERPSANQNPSGVQGNRHSLRPELQLPGALVRIAAATGIGYVFGATIGGLTKQRRRRNRALRSLD